MCCEADRQAKPGPVVIYDNQGPFMPFTDTQAERIDWAQMWARVHHRAVLATFTDDPALGTDVLGMRKGFEHAIAMLDEHPEAVMLVHRPEALEVEASVRALFAARVAGRVVATTGEQVEVFGTKEDLR